MGPADEEPSNCPTDLSFAADRCGEHGRPPSRIRAVSELRPSSAHTVALGLAPLARLRPATGPGRGPRVLIEIHKRAASQRIEIGCPGGVGRTGTAIACIAVLDGVPGSEAVAFVRERYHRRAVETPWQRRFVSNFAAVDGPPGRGAAPAVR